MEESKQIEEVTPVATEVTPVATTEITPTAATEVQLEVVVDNGVSLADDGTIKLDFNKINKTQTAKVETVSEVVEAIVEDTTAVVETPIIEEVVISTRNAANGLVKTAEPQTVSEVVSDVVQLPENIQKVVDFMNDTGGSLDDYVKLNTDYSKLDEDNLLKEFYEQTKPHLDASEIDFLLEDEFQYDEDIDEDRDIRRKKLLKKEELSKAKKYLEGLKTKYYDEIKAGSKLNPDQKKAVEFFDRYTKETEESTTVAERQSTVFQNETNQVFSDEFKGFEYNIGEKKYRFNVKNAAEVKDTQTDINNFVKKFLNDKNEMADAKGYHKSLFTAMNADAVANHFYEQGKADGLKNSIATSKNIDMTPRGTHEGVTEAGGMKFKAVPDSGNSKLRIKKR